jgi:hypothetical protein
LRKSDPIGRNSDGKISIIIDKETRFLLHNHNTGSVYIETYENIKEIIKSLSTLSKVHLHLDISKYDKDYITALITHGLSWSIMIHVPLMFLGGIRDDFFLLLSVLFNAVIHAIIDNLKANKLKINLDVDQCLHGLQIVITWIVFSLISYYQL